MENQLSSSLQVGTGSPSLNAGSAGAYGALTEESMDFRFDTETAGSPYIEFHELRRDPLYVVVPVTIIYATIFITGTVGNISTCIVIARNKSMHTATNYYLFSLAISDLLLLVSGMPAEIYMVWCKYPYIFGEGFCILRGLAAETSTNASVLTIAAFTVERYVAICHPFLSQTMSKLSRAVKLILAIWIIALSFALPQALQFGVVPFSESDPEMVMCLVKRIIVQHSFELSTFLFFVVPMCLITVLYALIGLKLRKSNMMKKSVGRADSARNCRNPGRSSRRVLKMLVAVVVAFFICWAPFHVQRLIAIYGTSVSNGVSVNKKWMEFLYLLMTYISGVLYYVSTTINPILYNIMSNKFRAAFMETLSRSCRVPGLATRTEQRSYSSLSRSQQRTAGAYGSRTIGTGGTGVPPDSTDCSGNSLRDESPRQTTSVMSENAADLPRPSEGNSRAIPPPGESVEASWRNGNVPNDGKTTARGGSTEEETPLGKNNSPKQARQTKEKSLWVRPTRYSAVRTFKVDRPRKKWWRLLKWLPSLKSLKLSGRGTYAAPDERVSDEREEFSMTVCNVGESNEQRPV